MAGAHIGSVFGIAGAVVVGVWCVQQSYASGRPDTVMACQTVIDPMVGVLVGVCLFGEAPNVGPLTVLGELTGAALTVVGVVALARRDRDIQLDGKTRRGERVDSTGQRRGAPR
jgi:drug/metabolite transporter (DMT)-like permease